LAQRIHYREAKLGHGTDEQRQSHFSTLPQCRQLIAFHVETVFNRLLEAIHHRQQLTREFFQGELVCFFHILLGPAAHVLDFRQSSHQLVFLVRHFRLQLFNFGTCLSGGFLGFASRGGLSTIHGFLIRV